MTLIITEQSDNKENAPAGLQPAVCVDAVDIGQQETPWGLKDKVMLIFELEAADSNGERFLLQKRYTKSLNEKSNLRKDLERWRGKPFSPKELERGFNLEKVIGIPCMLYIEHKDTDRGTFANIESILPPSEDQPPIEPSGNYQRATKQVEEA